MADYSFYALGESNLTISNGATLDGNKQGDGSGLLGETITIDTLNYDELLIADSPVVDTNFADNDGNQKLAGDQYFDGVLYSDATIIEAEYTLILLDPNTGKTYTVIGVNIRNAIGSENANSSIEGLAFVDEVPPVGVELQVISTSQGPTNNGTAVIEEGRIVPVCFAAGTRIATPDGDAPVETLRDGDTVLRSDGTEVRILRTFRSDLGPGDLLEKPWLRPVRFHAGALGKGLPRRDLRVSRQHRMQVSSVIAKRLFGTRHVLVPAVRLSGLPGIEVDESATNVTYVHLLFERHEIILAEGAPAESLYTGPYAVAALPDATRAELLSLYPELGDPDHTPPSALPILERADQKKLVARHRQKNKPLLESYTGFTVDIDEPV